MPHDRPRLNLLNDRKRFHTVGIIEFHFFVEGGHLRSLGSKKINAVSKELGHCKLEGTVFPIQKRTSLILHRNHRFTDCPFTQLKSMHHMIYFYNLEFDWFNFRSSASQNLSTSKPFFNSRLRFKYL